ncbi:MAG: hypothetical protein K0B14_20065, partial [Anaerolineaceae bacterium]|nr:hypothetical protein [Anaerolineaceae bacterium]
MKFDNYDRISRSLEILRDGLSKYIETQLKANYKDEWWQKGIIKPLDEASKDKQLKNDVTPENCWNYLDLSQLFWIITYWETWNSIFSKNNDKYKKQTVFNLREIRNQHAHPNKKFDAFSNEMTTKNLDSMIEFLKGIGRDHEAEKIRVLKNKKFSNVPYPRNNAFVGREDQLLEIQNKFRQIISSKKNIILLTGLGGIGKTQLALEYAYRYQDLYTDGIFWVNSASGFQEEFIKIAGNFISNYLFEKELREDEVVKLFFEYLDDNSNALIIIDNLDDFNILDIPIFGLIPTNLSGNVLITSRKGSMKSGDNSMEVKGIAPDEALALLFSGTTRKKFFENQSSDSVDLEYAISV